MAGVAVVAADVGCPGEVEEVAGAVEVIGVLVDAVAGTPDDAVAGAPLDCVNGITVPTLGADTCPG